LIEGGLEEVILTTLLNICREKGWLKERGKQRTDSTPEGKTSKKWTVKQKKNGQEEIWARFGEID